MVITRTTETQGNHDLFDAFDQPGCAVCTLTTAAVSRYMTSTNYDSVADPEIRLLFEASQGFCNLHAHQWQREALVLGTAQIYRDVLRVTFDDLRRQRVQSRPLGQRVGALLGRNRIGSGTAGLAGPLGSCPACDIHAEAERRLQRTLIRGLSKPDFRAAYLASDGLCIPHLRPALLEAPTADVFDALQQRAIQTRELLLAQLDETVRKHDYRFRHEPAGDEKGSSARAVDHVIGKQGITPVDQ